jgi:hypothetical protein
MAATKKNGVGVLPLLPDCTFEHPPLTMVYQIHVAADRIEKRLIRHQTARKKRLIA